MYLTKPDEEIFKLSDLMSSSSSGKGVSNTGVSTDSGQQIGTQQGTQTQTATQQTTPAPTAQTTTSTATTPTTGN